MSRRRAPWAPPLVAALLLSGVLAGCGPAVDEGPAGGGGSQPGRAQPGGAPPATLAATRPAVPFTDVTEAAGVRFLHRAGGAVKDWIPEAKGGGATLLDADGDGRLDLYLVNGGAFDDGGPPPGPNQLYLNRGDGTFGEVGAEAGAAGAAGRRWGMGAVSADYDGDGDADLLVTNLDGTLLLRNDGGSGVPRFADVSVEAGASLQGWTTGAAFADADLDGDLDLYVARYVDFDRDAVPPRAGMWKGLMVFAGPQGLPAAADALLRNLGDGTFADVSQESGVRSPPPAYGLGVVFADFDQDGDPDLFVANDSAPNFLLRNQTGSAGGALAFREVAVEAGAALSAEGVAQAGMGVAYGDYDADGDGDLFVTNFEDDYNTLYRNRGDGTFAVASSEAGLAQPGIPFLAFGTCFFDADNDGDLDLAVGNGHVYPQIRLRGAPGYAQPDHLFLNGGPAAGYRFALADAGDLSRPGVTRSLLHGDWDGDGDVDLVALHLDGPAVLLRNDLSGGGHWLTVALEGDRANRNGVGALVSVVAGGARQTREVIAGEGYLSGGDLCAHFGLGPHAAAERVEVRWPGGGLQVVEAVAADRVLAVRR